MREEVTRWHNVIEVGECEAGLTMTIATQPHQWPAEGLTRVPYWVYCDRDIYETEQERIFRGRPGIFSASRPSCRAPTAIAARSR